MLKALRDWWEYQDLGRGLEVLVNNYTFEARETKGRERRLTRWRNRARILVRKHQESYLGSGQKWSSENFLADVFEASGKNAADIPSLLEILEDADYDYGNVDKFPIEDSMSRYQIALRSKNPPLRILAWRQRAYALAEADYNQSKAEGVEWSPQLFLQKVARATGANPSLIREWREDLDQLVVDLDIDITSDEYFLSRGWVRPSNPRTWLKEKYVWYLVVDGLMQQGYIVNGEKVRWGENMVDKDGKPMRPSGSQDVESNKDRQDLPDWLQLLRKKGR